jgi:hypothetical protein
LNRQEIALLTGVLVAPLLISGAAWLWLRRSRSTVLDRPLGLADIWRQVLGVSISPRTIAKVLILVFPILFYDSLGFIGSSLLWYLALGYGVWRLFRSSSALPSDTQVLLAELEDQAGKLAVMRANVEQVAQLVALKARELEQKNAERLALEKVISEKMRESQEFQNLTEGQWS